MKNEISCGAIAYKIVDDQRYYLVVQQKEGFWGFPKGHLKEGETEEECAYREVREETDLLLWAFREDFREVDEHPIPGTDINKRIVYFLGALITAFDDFNQEPKIQTEELLDARFVTIEEAEELMPYEDRYNKARMDILRKADAVLEAEKKDLEFCRSADQVLFELKEMAMRDGMEYCREETEPTSTMIVMRTKDLIVDFSNNPHLLEIVVTPENLGCGDRVFDVIGYYSAIYKKYPEKHICVAPVNGCSDHFDNPGLAIEIAYDNVFPQAEDLKCLMDSLIEIMLIHEPVIRTIAKGQPVPKDGSEASQLYYDAYLNSEQYKQYHDLKLS